MEEQPHKLKKDIERRIKVLHILFICIVAYFLVHTIVFIFIDKKMEAEFEQLYKKELIKDEVIMANRGNIYSRNGEVLATTITRTSVNIDFACEAYRKMGQKLYNENAKALAEVLAECLGDKSVKDYYKILIENNAKSLEYYPVIDTTKKRKWIFFKELKLDTTYSAKVKKGALRFERIFRDLDANEWAIIKKAPLIGEGSTCQSKEYKYRITPHGELASRAIGRMGTIRGFTGIEFAYQDTLAGRNGYQRVQQVTNRLKIRVEDPANIDVKNGHDVVTTLDVNVQDVTHNALSKQILSENAIWGTTIVMECATGDILAMSNLKNNGDHCKEIQNYAIGVPVNPGSTFKLMSAMALLERGVSPSRKYNTGLGKEVPIGTNTNSTIKDSHPIGEETDGDIDMRTAFAESSNVYFTSAVYDEFGKSPVDFTDFCNKIHLNEKVGLEEFGATYKVIEPLDKKHVSRYNALVDMAYGYTIEITPLHTLAVYNAVANNGKMVAPRLILRTEHNGKVVSEAPIRVIDEQICSPRTLKTLRSFLEDVSKVGTAKAYFGEKVCPFTSGSKTGTAQVESEINKVNYKRSDGYYYGSMVTYFPADKPRYTIITAIFTKKQVGKQYYGAGLAGPVQKHIATYLYNRDHHYAQEVTSSKYTASDIKSGNISKIQTVANKHGVAISSQNNEGWGTNITSKSGKSIHISPLKIETNVVPNVIGMGLNDALFILEKSGLNVKVIGKGKVVSQSVAPNTGLTEDTEGITIRLE